MAQSNSTARAGAEAQLHSILDLSGAVLYYTSYPTRKAIRILYVLVAAVLRPIWNVAVFLLLPVAYIASAAASAAALPFALLAKFETLYIYLAIAVLIGLLSGAILHLVSSTASGVFQLDGNVSRRQPKRSVATYRRDRSKKKSRASGRTGRFPGLVSPALRPRGPSGSETLVSRGRGGAARGNLLSSTILEEDDSDASET